MRVILPQSDEISAKIGQGKYKYYRSKETKFQQKLDKESTNITTVFQQKLDKESKFYYKYYRS